jgi:lipopolysaccharide/colanic/teichoic acid biosynthesis glycosyltransferase
MGDMSLVGPRPKLREHQIGKLACRPGITGAATIAFAREEQLLARLPMDRLEDFYFHRILPLKHNLDAEYMARATFASDLKLLMDSVLHRWDTSVLEELLRESTSRQSDESVHVFLDSEESVDRVINYVRTVEPDCFVA